MENTLAAPDSGQRRKEKENLKMENTLDVHLSWERLYTCLQNVKTCPYCPSVIKITTSGGHIIGTYLSRNEKSFVRQFLRQKINHQSNIFRRSVTSYNFQNVFETWYLDITYNNYNLCLISYCPKVLATVWCAVSKIIGWYQAHNR